MKRRAAHQRPGMRAEQLPPPMQGAGEPTGSVGGSSSPLQAPPPAPPHSPEEEEALTPALLSADNVEVRIDDDGVAPALAAPAVEAAPAAAAAAVWTATEPVALGSYEADKAAALGTGSFGVVVRGVVLETGEGVAIKLVPMPTRRAAGEEEGEEDYDSVRREAVIGGALQHRNIARLFACVYRPGDTASLETLEGVKPCSSGTLYMVQVGSPSLSSALLSYALTPKPSLPCTPSGASGWAGHVLALVGELFLPSVRKRSLLTI
jgi:hypothetical protein